MSFEGAAISLGATVISVAFASLVFAQWLGRRRPYQLAWSLGLGLYAVAAFTQFLAEAYGWSVTVYKIYYVLAALLVAVLGIGSLFLVHRRAGIGFTLYTAIITVGFAAAVAGATVNTNALSSPIPVAGMALPDNVRTFSYLFTIPGSVALIGIAAYSYCRTPPEFHDQNRKQVGRTILHCDAVESTNETAKELLESDVEEGLVVWADRQAAGRGRHGRAWASPLGGLYASFMLRPKEAHAWLLGLLVGMPVVKALRHFGVFAGLKYPNDAGYQNRKIAGILSEGVYRHDVYHVVGGIGVNTNVDLDKLPADVQPKATTLKREVSLFVANEEFLDYLLNQVDDLYSRYRNTRIEFLLKDYRGQCTTIGKRVSVTMGKEKLTGKAYDIGPNGALVIIDDLGAKHDFFEGTLEILK